MTSSITQTPRWQRLMDGDRSWGSLHISPTRYGITRYRLVMFPPGLTAERRRALRLWRSWPTWGLALWVVLEVILLPTMGSIPALIISTFAAAAGGAVAMARVDDIRREVRTCTVLRMTGCNEAETAEAFGRLKSHAFALAYADRKLADGELTAPGHESMMWQVYDRMPAA